MLLIKALQRALRTSRKHIEDREKSYLVLFGALELALIAVGIYFTLTQLRLTTNALRENTTANRTASRSQLYASENEILAREFETAGSSLASLYAHPPSAVTDPVAYCRDRLRLISQDKAVLSARNVDELYETFYGMRSFEKEDDGIVELRKAYVHLTAILDHMHAAVDYQHDQVMTADELDTWLGYTTDIGPHPVFLSVIKGWHSQKYMSRAVAEKIRELMLAADPRNRRVIAYYYPAMLTDGFLSELPNY